MPAISSVSTPRARSWASRSVVEKAPAHDHVALARRDRLVDRRARRVVAQRVAAARGVAAHAAGRRERLQVRLGEGDAHVADGRAPLTCDRQRAGRALEQRLRVLEYRDDAVLVVHHEQGGALGIDRIGHAGSLRNLGTTPRS
jgi:hypothetical protein